MQPYGIRFLLTISKSMISSWFERGISHMGYENNPTYPAAVGNFGQYAQAWPSELVGVKKTMTVVKPARKVVQITLSF